MNSGPTGKLRSAKPVEACGPPTAQRPMTCHSPKSAQVDGQSIRLWRLIRGVAANKWDEITLGLPRACLPPANLSKSLRGGPKVCTGRLVQFVDPPSDD
ncbi:hypothetical protein PGT21_021014 [Puccinia graminis f. sp. tritici]|uniref:Uncharacterized protein n=1 Tax=Puccinia graminis f. sp. tritici TaxID=56615 RepID=A0A5B0QUN3_PUCGR|nr:hypothetical protein PGT21_021014 [Puccinia graminis f. sp. tritici]